MRETARMLSPISLAALSSGPVQAGSVAAQPVQRVRAVAARPPVPIAPTTGASRQSGEGGAMPERTLPRGSLLDLSV
jgi:hypothetical protein